VSHSPARPASRGRQAEGRKLEDRRGPWLPQGRARLSQAQVGWAGLGWVGLSFGPACQAQEAGQGGREEHEQKWDLKGHRAAHWPGWGSGRRHRGR
jgi:hypothetical protein